MKQEARGDADNEIEYRRESVDNDEEHKPESITTLCDRLVTRVYA